MESEEKRLLESVREEIAGLDKGSEQEKAAYFIFGLTIAVVLTSIFTMIMVVSKSSQINSLDSQINEQVTIPLNNLAKERKQVTSISSQLDVLKTALSSRINYQKILSVLAKNTYSKTKWVGFDYSDDKIVLTGLADDFAGVSKSVSAIKAASGVESAELTSVNINKENQSIEYAIAIKFNPVGFGMSGTGSVNKGANATTK